MAIYIHVYIIAVEGKILMIVYINFFLVDEDEFLSNLDEWEASVNSRTGFTLAQKKRILISAKTLLGLRMTSTYVS